MVLGGSQQGSGMGRQKAVHGRKPRQHRQAHQHGGPSAAPRRIRHDGHQQNQPHFEEHRDTHQNAQRQQRPGHAPRTASIHHCLTQRRSRTGTGQKLPENRAHAENDGDMAHHLSGSGGEGEGYLFERNARRHAQCQGGH
jgi:hypothetical protein